MYQGQNPSALRSMEWLSNALIELLKSERYDQITVKEICRKADLSRQTFYQMFDSKEEVIQYCFSVLFQEFVQKCDSFQNVTLSGIVRSFFSFFYEQRGFVEILIANNMVYMLEQQFEIYLCKIALFCNMGGQTLHGDYTTAYMAGALTQILIHWFQQHFDLSVEALSELTESVIMGRTASGFCGAAR